ncbi:MAG: HD domain-containing protein [Candidatus Dependentiae bacterium]|nr:HD domain-containing protein [Candidatus Dependentiae bacterium]
MTTKKLTKNLASVQRSLSDMLHTTPVVSDIVHEINRLKGRVLLVGGAVRDLLLGRSIKDLDFEVYHLSLADLEKALSHFGNVRLAGKSFGVLRLDGLDVDWSVPRSDNAGRKPHVTINENMSMHDAFARRDLTMNAMGIDVITGELIDPFNGLHDLENGILRAPSPTLFVEDPLRFYRVMQFIGRFDAYPDEQLNELCSRMDLSHVSIERIEVEFEKLLLRSERPSQGIRWLARIGRITDVLPELAATISVEQEYCWHPEGDVFEHTMQSIDAAAALSYTDDEEKLLIIYAALCHDLGKVTTSTTINGKIHSHGHEIAGIEPAKNLLKRITNKKIMIETVPLLVRYHMLPFVFEKAGIAAYKRLAKKLAPRANLSMLCKLALADKRGRGLHNTPLLVDFPVLHDFMRRAENAQIFYKPEEPLLQGKDIIDCVAPGPQMGALLKKAYTLQIEKGITDKEQLKERVLGRKKRG